jgi:hypothetical protein
MGSTSRAFGIDEAVVKIVAMMVKEGDDCASQEFRTCHFASLAEVIDPLQ